MKVGDLVTVIYTRGFAKTPIVGLVISTNADDAIAATTTIRRRTRVLIDGDTFWMDNEDLEVTSESR